TASDEQRVDGLGDEFSKKFMLDYNFPPFSVGECKPIRGPGRREIGHGALAERSLKAVLPSPDRFPYTIRLVSDILESNGSSSMARSEEHTSELQSRFDLVCRLLLEKKKSEPPEVIPRSTVPLNVFLLVT